jgi:hypothetical protein
MAFVFAIKGITELLDDSARGILCRGRLRVPGFGESGERKSASRQGS